jgi:hypothetical protein
VLALLAWLPVHDPTGSGSSSHHLARIPTTLTISTTVVAAIGLRASAAKPSLGKFAVTGTV